MHKVYLYYTVETNPMKFFIMCVGNRDGGDDAIGPYVADKLKDLEDRDGFVILDCATVPENYTSVVKQHKPRKLLIIDAVEMGLKPGEIRIVPKEKIGSMHISTHGIPISVLINYLEDYVDNIILIGIQPSKMSGEITAPVRINGDILVELIKNNKLEFIKTL